MEEQVEIFIFASPEIEQLLADNQTDLAELLREEGVQVTKAFSEDPAKNSDSGYKDPTTVILASSALALSLTPILSKILAYLSNRPVVVHDLELRPVESSTKTPVYDNSGQPVLYWTRRARSIEPPQQHESSEVKIKATGFEISYVSTPTE